MLGPLLHQSPQTRGVPQIEHADPAPRDLVFVGRADPPPRGPDRLARRALLVHELVVRHHEMRPIGEVEPPRDIDPRRDQTIDLLEHPLGIEHHPFPMAHRTPGVEDPARDLVENRRLIPDMDGVTGVGAPW